MTLVLVALALVESFYLLDIRGTKGSPPLFSSHIKTKDAESQRKMAILEFSSCCLEIFFIENPSFHHTFFSSTGDESNCRKPDLDEKGLTEYGCKMISRACVDQVGLVCFILVEYFPCLLNNN